MVNEQREPDDHFKRASEIPKGNDDHSVLRDLGLELLRYTAIGFTVVHLKELLLEWK